MGVLGTAPYSFEALICLGWTGVFLLLGFMLRNLVPFFRKYLVPSCMLGGLLGLFAANMGVLNLFGSARPNFSAFQTVIFHMFNLTFICFGLGGFGSGIKGAGRNILKGMCYIATASCAVCGFMIVGIVLFIVGWNAVFGVQLFESAGQIMFTGFGAGPGAAMSMGRTWEQAGVPGGLASLGLAYGALGYVCSLLVGVPVATWMRKKRGLPTGDAIPEAEQRGVYAEDAECPPAGLLRTMSHNIDGMSFQAALMLLAYLMAYGVMGLLSLALPPKGMGIVWSLFSSMICLPCGIIVKEALLKRVFHADCLFDSGCHTRLLNILVDFVAVASLLGIQITVLKEWWPIMLPSCAVLSAIVVAGLWLCYRKNAEYGAERFLGGVGNLTGSITSGLVLIRIIDPEYKSTVPQELSLQGIPITIWGIVTLPLFAQWKFAQVFFDGTWVPQVLLSLCTGIGFFLLLKLPFWHMDGRKAQF